MLSRDTLTGPWAGLPVAWTQDNLFDEKTYREDITRCCNAGIPGVYTGGTTGEFYAMEFDEFAEIASATVGTCHNHKKPVMIGCSSTYTLGAIRRAKHAAEIGADAIQVTLPFWMELGERQILEFFKEVSASCGNLPLSIYETTRAKQTLSLAQHQAIHDEVPNYLMVKSNHHTLGASPEGCKKLSEIVNVFVSENLWPDLCPYGAKGSCSAMVYWNPALVLEIWTEVEKENWHQVEYWGKRIQPLFEFLQAEFGSIGLTDTAFDRLGSIATGFLGTNLTGRKPYPSATDRHVEVLREWLLQNLPEMLELRS